MAGGQEIPLRAVFKLQDLGSGCFYHHQQTITVCLDLSAGQSNLKVSS
jgi:hypothetical protein